MDENSTFYWHSMREWARRMEREEANIEVMLPERNLRIQGQA